MSGSEPSEQREMQARMRGFLLLSYRDRGLGPVSCMDGRPFGWSENTRPAECQSKGMACAFASQIWPLLRSTPRNAACLRVEPVEEASHAVPSSIRTPGADNTKQESMKLHHGWKMND